jgi:aminopeptidase N
MDTYLGEAGARYQRPIVCRDYVEPIDLFDRHLYEKGGLVLHMLRRELTDAVFFEGVQKYLKRHAFGIVETTDLMRAFEEVSGRSLERFFDHWVYRPGHPELKVSVGYDDGLLSVALKQTQKHGETALFALPIEIEVTHNDGTRTRHHKLMTEAHDVLTLPLDKRPLHVGFDPEQRVIGKLTFEAPGDMVRHQLAEGSNALLRWAASMRCVIPWRAKAKPGWCAWKPRARWARCARTTRSKRCWPRARRVIPKCGARWWGPWALSRSRPRPRPCRRCSIRSPATW